MNKGFTLVETILALLVTSFCVIMFSSLIALMKPIHYENHILEDETNLQQIRVIFALSKDFNVDKKNVSLHYLDKDMNFAIKEDKLILQDGYQVFLTHLEEAYFKEEEKCVYLFYRHKKQTKKTILGCE